MMICMCLSVCLSVCMVDKMPMIRDARTGDWIGTLKGHKGAVWSCSLDPKAYLAATASGDFTVKLWDAVTGKLIHEYPHKHIVKTVSFSPDSLKMATGGHEGLLRVYDLEKGSKCIPKQIPVSTNKHQVSVIIHSSYYPLYLPCPPNTHILTTLVSLTHFIPLGLSSIEIP